jgi:hypothetical protein
MKYAGPPPLNNIPLDPAHPSAERDVGHGNVGQPDQPQQTLIRTATESSDTITVTVTLPTSVVTTGQEFNITFTPRAQRTAEPPTRTRTDESGPACPPTPVNSPRPRVPRFDLPGLMPRSTANVTANVDDPFSDSGSHDTSTRTDIHIPASGRGTRDTAIDIASDDEGDFELEPIYPPQMNHASTSRPTLQSEPCTTRVGAKYYVITKGRRLGVFYDSWYVSYIYRQHISSHSIFI